MKITVNGMCIEYQAGEEASVAALLRELQKPTGPKQEAKPPRKVAVSKPKAKTVSDYSIQYRRRVNGQSAQIRTWAAQNGFKVARIGTIPSEVLDAWESQQRPKLVGGTNG